MAAVYVGTDARAVLRVAVLRGDLRRCLEDLDRCEQDDAVGALRFALVSLDEALLRLGRCAALAPRCTRRRS